MGMTRDGKGRSFIFPVQKYGSVMVKVLVHFKEISHPLMLCPHNPAALRTFPCFYHSKSTLPAKSHFYITNKLDSSYHTEGTLARFPATDRPPTIPVKVSSYEMSDKITSDTWEHQFLGLSRHHPVGNECFSHDARENLEMTSMPSFSSLLVNVLVEGDGVARFHRLLEFFKMSSIFSAQAQLESSHPIVVFDITVCGNEAQPVGFLFRVNEIKEVLVNGIRSMVSRLEYPINFKDLLNLVVMESQPPRYRTGRRTIGVQIDDRLACRGTNRMIVLGYERRSSQTTLNRVPTQPHFGGHSSNWMSIIESLDNFCDNLVWQFGWHTHIFVDINEKPCLECKIVRP